MSNQMEYEIAMGHVISYTDPDEAAMAYGEAVGYVLINRALQNFGGHGTTLEEQTTTPGAYAGPGGAKLTIDLALSLQSKITPAAMEAALVCATYDCDIIMHPKDPSIKMSRDVTGESAWSFGHEVFWWLDMQGWNVPGTDKLGMSRNDTPDEYATSKATATKEKPYPVGENEGGSKIYGESAYLEWPWDGYLTYSY